MASPGAGAEPEGVRIDYGAPSSGCPDAAGFLRALRERTTDFRQAMPDEQARTFTIHVAPMGSAYSGQLEVRGLTGSVAVRHVEAKSCDQVVNALALITALAISPSALMDGPKSADNAADKMAESTADRDRSPTVQKIAPSAMQDEAQPWQWSAGMLGLMVTRVSPNLSYGGELFAEVEAPASSRWGPSFRLGAFFTQSRTEFAAPADASARFQWFGAALEGCPVRLVGWGRRLAVAPCVTLHLGGLRAQGRGISQPKKAASFWADAGPLLRLRLALTARISLEAHGALILPLTQPTFEIMDMVSRKPAAEYSVARWGISVAVGAAYGFQ
jgi:hypothetical protein